MSTTQNKAEARPIPFAPGYLATSNGVIISTLGTVERRISPVTDNHGYLCVRMTIDGKRKHMPIHRIVARVFLEPRPTAVHEVCHRDGNKLNNAAANLRWGTRKENADDRAAHGRTSRGAQHSAAIKAGLEARHG